METIKIIFDYIKNRKFENAMELIDKDNNFDVNIRDNNTYIIQYAIMYNNIDFINFLLKKACKLDFIDDEGHSILYTPIKYSYIEVLNILLSNTNNIGIPLVDIVDKNGNLPIHYSLYYDNNDVFDILIKHTSQFNKLNNEGYAPLHISVKKKNYRAINILTEMIETVNINCQTNIGETSLHLACNYQDEKIVETLLNNKNINLDVIDYENQITPLMYAVALNNINITKLLLTKNPTLNIQNVDGNSALHIAMIENNDVIANILINKTTNFNLINIDGMTPLHLLLNQSIEDLSKINKYNIDLLLNKTKLNKQDMDGNTIWHILSIKDLWFSYKNILKTKKNNLFIKNSENLTPYDMLKNSKQFDILLNIIIDSYYNLLIENKIEYIADWENKCSLKKKDINECKKYIKENILINNKSVPDRKTLYCSVEIDIGNNILFTTFTGSSIDIVCGLRKLHDDYHIISTLNNKNLIKNPELEKYYLQLGIRKNDNDFLNFEIQWLYQNIFYPDNFEIIIEKFIKSKDYNFFIIPIGIEIENGAHANILIYDKKNNTLERFEPNGSDEPPNFNYNFKLLDTLLNNYFKKYFKTMTYLTPKMFLPKIGFQAFENIENSKNKKIGDPGGFCAAWCLFYVTNRLKYNSIPSNQLVKQLITHIKYNNLSFKNIIRNFSKYINDYRDNILSYLKLDINEWINNQYTNKDVLELQKIILKSLY